MTRVHDAHFTAIHVAQQARKEARAADHAYLTTPATRWQTGGNSFHTDAIGAVGCRATVQTLQRPSPADCRTYAQPSPAVPSVAAVGAPKKFANVETEGYASKKEEKRAFDLRLMQEAGIVRCLREQVVYVLIPRQLDAGGKIAERACTYKADFVYEEWSADGWRSVVEDCKGFRTQQYIIRRKLMRFTYGVAVRET